MSEFLKSLLVILSNPDKQRIEVQMLLICIAFAVAMLSPALGVAFVFVLVYGYHPLWIKGIQNMLERHGWRVAVIVPAILFLILASSRLPMARDDLLRDIIIGPYYQFSYQNLYFISDLPTFSLWFGFDHALAWMQNWMTPLVVMRVVQLALYLSLTAIVALVVEQMLEGRRDRMYWAGAAVSVAIMLAVGRLALGRPEILLSIWAIASLLVRTRSGVVVWSLLGAALSTTYWLAFLYFPAVLLFDRDMRYKMVAVMTLVSFHLVFWLSMFGGDYLQALAWLPEVMKNQITMVSENLGLEHAFGSPLFLLLLGTSAIGVVKHPTPRALALALLAAYFIGANQVRYLGIIGPLLVLLSFLCWKDRLPTLTVSGKAILAATSTLALMSAAVSIPSERDMPKFKLNAESKVITAFGEAAYAIPFFNPGVKVEPSYAFGAAPKDVQQLALDISEGRPPNCAVLNKYQFTHVVEQSLTGPASECLILVETNNKWRLWNVR